MCEGWRMFILKIYQVTFVKSPKAKTFEDHKFSDFTQSQLINMAFGENIVRDLDHDL